MLIYNIKFKIEIITILFYGEELSHLSLSLAVYLLNFLFNFFMNAFLYSDDVISQKYHNNGQLNILTTLFLSLTSNIISNIFSFYIKKLLNYKEYLIIMIKDLKRQYSYILAFKKLYKALLIKIWTYCLLSVFLTLSMSLYILIFCQIYQKSQNSLLMNYLMSLVESFAYSVCASLIISSLRLIGIKCKLIQIYQTSVYLDDKL